MLVVRVKEGKVHGLRGDYYIWRGDEPPVSPREAEYKLTRIDPEVNFVWIDEPAPGVDAGKFMVEWRGFLYAPMSGDYIFYAVVDDGCRVWIDGELVIDAWKDQAPTPYHSPPVMLTAGYHAIRVLYYNNDPFGVMRLGWIRPDKRCEIIPSRNFIARAGDEIKIKGVPKGWKVEFWCGRKLAEGVSGNGEAVLDARNLVQPIDGYFKIYGANGEYYETPVIRDVWGGDVFEVLST